MPPELTKVCNQIDVGELLKHPDFAGAADKAVNLVGCKSPRHQLPGIGSLACPMPAEETKQVLLGCKSLGCSATSGRSGRNDLAGADHISQRTRP